MGAFLSAKGAVPFLAKRLPPEAAADGERVVRLVGELDSPRFTTREGAERELTRLADSAVPALRRTLGNNPFAEVRQRVERILKTLELPITNAEVLRKLRAVEVLERVGTPLARDHLRALAGGVSESELTRAATAAFKRLAGD